MSEVANFLAMRNSSVTWRPPSLGFVATICQSTPQVVVQMPGEPAACWAHPKNCLYGHLDGNRSDFMGCRASCSHQYPSDYSWSSLHCFGTAIPVAGVPGSGVGVIVIW